MDDKRKKLASINTGEMLIKYFEDNRIRKSGLARVLNRNINSLNSYLNKSSIQTSILFELCHALNHNFFAEFAAAIPKEYTSNIAVDNSSDEQIKVLKREIEILKAEKAVLLEVLQSKV